MAKKELLKHIAEIDKEISFRIETAFNSVSINFSEIFWETVFNEKLLRPDTARKTKPKIYSEIIYINTFYLSKNKFLRL